MHLASSPLRKSCFSQSSWFFTSMSPKQKKLYCEFLCWGFAPLLRCLKTRLVPSSCKALPVRYSWGGSSENYYHQTQQWCCHISVDSSTSSEFAKARRPLILLRIVSAGATSEWSWRDNYPLPYTTSKPWAEFHLVVHWQHFTFTCRHLSRHCATYKAEENRILQIWTGVPVICSHTHFHLPNCK